MRKLKLWTRWGISRSRRSKFVLQGFNDQVLGILNAVVPGLLLVCVGLVVYEFGFKSFWLNNKGISFWYEMILTLLSVLIGFRILLELFTKKKKWARFMTVLGWIFVLLLTFYVLPVKTQLAGISVNRYIFFKLLLYAGIVIAFITEASYYLQFIYSRSLNPGLLFIGSFGFLVLIGTFLLKLPNATNGHIATLDALFTATSAVCVTGLIVVDTATQFTPFGQLIIMILIQLGGLGIMTFAGLLAYAVAGHTSFKTQIAFKDMMSGRQLGNIMRFIYQVVIVTIFFESLGAMFIYLSLDEASFRRPVDKLFFSVFHAISAFCNAGFSTYSNGLYEPAIRFNYSLQLFIAFLVILGGMGFPIVFNLYKYLKVKMINFIRKLKKDPKREHFPGLIFLNARLALVVSIALLSLGFIVYLVFEQQNTLVEHPGIVGKLVTSFFGSVTPRTAGFNTVDMSLLSLPTIMIYLLLMWIGASPGSTGGGIKTTTFGLAVLNMAAVLRGKDRTEFFRSEISHQSVRRAFTIIMLSLFFIGVSIFFVSLNDSSKGLISIAFEVFSAFSTVGLTLGITPELTGFSKVVIIITMFVGRVGMITLLVAFIRQSRQLYYRYPKEEIAF